MRPERAAAWEALVVRYGGNALALQVVGETIADLFGGEIAAFLAQAIEITHSSLELEQLSAASRIADWPRVFAIRR